MTTCQTPRCEITTLEEGGRTVKVKVVFEPSGVTGDWSLWGEYPILDWGDGSTQPVSNFTYEKTYDSPDERVITLTGTNTCGKSCMCCTTVFKSGADIRTVGSVLIPYAVAFVVAYTVIRIIWK